MAKVLKCQYCNNLLIPVGYLGEGKLLRCENCNILYSHYDNDPMLNLETKLQKITGIEIGSYRLWEC